MDIKVVTDSGPLIHLAEINAIETWSVFEKVWLPDVVFQEVTARPSELSDSLDLKGFVTSKTDTDILAQARRMIALHKLSPNDALILGHALQLSVSLLLTDDLEVRGSAKREGIRPVGSVGLLLKAYRSGIYSYAQLFELLDRIHTNSSLYITSDVIDEVKIAAHDYERMLRP